MLPLSAFSAIYSDNKLIVKIYNRKLLEMKFDSRKDAFIWFKDNIFNIRTYYSKKFKGKRVIEVLN